MQKLPIGEQFFTNLRGNQMVYVDKTRQIYDLLNVGRFVFLSRPRRFGKSLLTTTIREICRGNRTLFQGLWIYDKPITDLLENSEQVQEHIDTLKDFYAVLKSSGSEHLKFTLITGVSKYGKVSIFSDLNNLTDITLDPHFATLLGYTQAELEHYFPAYLDRLAQTYQLSRAAMLAQIAFWYDGYSWDGVERVYVPFSTLLFLDQQVFANHWFATGTPTFLIKLLRKNRVPAYDLERFTADSTLVERADVNNISGLALLFQTGYLTVKQVHNATTGVTYDLGYPNHEVAQAFQQHLLTDYLEANADLSASLLRDFKGYLATKNLDGFITRFQAVFVDIPSRLFLPQEAYYHSVVYLTLRLLGFTIYAERMTNLGRIDAVLELTEVVYLLEFKMSTAQIALDQIRQKHYAQPYLGGSKTVILLGIAFDKNTRNIADWQQAVIGPGETVA